MAKKPIVYVDMDGVVANFRTSYNNHFNRDVDKDDSFTVNKFCLQEARFFRYLPVLGKGFELVDLLKEEYRVIFLTTPMEGMEYCKRDKIDWVRENFGDDYDVIFSINKAEYVIDESSILIDDMSYNLEPWRDAGGTAININNSIDRIFEIIEEAVYGRKAVFKVKEQIEKMEVEKPPSEAQKEAGNYKKGKILFKKMTIMIENPKGSIRFGFDEYGKKWVTRMNSHYGYICGENDAADGDKVDCFIGPNYNKSLAFVINQNKGDGMFDEFKVILGCNDLEEAKALYLANYQKGWESRIDSIVQTNTKKIRSWVDRGNLNEPFE